MVGQEEKCSKSSWPESEIKLDSNGQRSKINSALLSWRSDVLEKSNFVEEEKC